MDMVQSYGGHHLSYSVGVLSFCAQLHFPVLFPGAAFLCGDTVSFVKGIKIVAAGGVDWQ